MIDFTRRRFLFGLAAVPLVVPAVKHFVMPRFELVKPESLVGTVQMQGSADGVNWVDINPVFAVHPGKLRRSYYRHYRQQITTATGDVVFQGRQYA